MDKTTHTSIACYDCAFRDQGYQPHMLVDAAKLHHETTGHRTRAISTTERYWPNERARFGDYQVSGDTR